jgi:hypothetical protein
LKQWGTYKNNPCVVEDGLTEQQDPPDNGKGGGIGASFPTAHLK